MRTTNLFRSVLALGAVLAVAGPGLVLAGEPAYTPKIVQVDGPNSVPVNSEPVNFDATVTFTDDTQVTFTGATDGLVWAAVRGSIEPDGDGAYTPPATTGRDRITVTYTANGVSVTGARFIQNP